MNPSLILRTRFFSMFDLCDLASLQQEPNSCSSLHFRTYSTLHPFFFLDEGASMVARMASSACIGAIIASRMVLSITRCKAALCFGVPVRRRVAAVIWTMSILCSSLWCAHCLSSSFSYIALCFLLTNFSVRFRSGVAVYSLPFNPMARVMFTCKT